MKIIIKRSLLLCLCLMMAVLPTMKVQAAGGAYQSEAYKKLTDPDYYEAQKRVEEYTQYAVREAQKINEKKGNLKKYLPGGEYAGVSSSIMQDSANDLVGSMLEDAGYVNIMDIADTLSICSYEEYESGGSVVLDLLKENGIDTSGLEKFWAYSTEEKEMLQAGEELFGYVAAMTGREKEVVGALKLLGLNTSAVEKRFEKVPTDDQKGLSKAFDHFVGGWVQFWESVGYFVGWKEKEIKEIE